MPGLVWGSTGKFTLWFALGLAPSVKLELSFDNESFEGSRTRVRVGKLGL